MKLTDLPVSIRVGRILNMLDPESLMESSITSKQFRWECKEHPGIENKIVPAIILRSPKHGKGSIENVVQIMCQYQQDIHKKEKLKKYHHMQVIDASNYEYMSRDAIEELTINVSMDEVTSLDISNHPPSSSLYSNLWYALSYILPNLRKIDISYSCHNSDAISKFVTNCPLLETLRCNGIDRRYSWVNPNGQDLQSARTLKEIIIDDPTFYTYGNQEDMLDLINHPNTFIFHLCGSKILERVSIRNAKWVSYQGVETVPQTALIKFVRNAPSTLKWFRSDLSEENSDLLRKERPQIEFLN